MHQGADRHEPGERAVHSEQVGTGILALHDQTDGDHARERQGREQILELPPDGEQVEQEHGDEDVGELLQPRHQQRDVAVTARQREEHRHPVQHDDGLDGAPGPDRVSAKLEQPAHEPHHDEAVEADDDTPAALDLRRREKAQNLVGIAEVKDRHQRRDEQHRRIEQIEAVAQQVGEQQVGEQHRANGAQHQAHDPVVRAPVPLIALGLPDVQRRGDRGHRLKADEELALSGWHRQGEQRRVGPRTGFISGHHAGR